MPDDICVVFYPSRYFGARIQVQVIFAVKITDIPQACESTDIRVLQSTVDTVKQVVIIYFVSFFVIFCFCFCL